MNSTEQQLVDYDELLDSLRNLWGDFLRRRKTGLHSERSREGFRAMVRRMVTDPHQVSIEFCADCANPEDFDRRMFWVLGAQRVVCSPCYGERYDLCYSCENSYLMVDMTSIDDELICNNCRNSYYRWCETCDSWYHYEDSGSHRHRDDCCESPAMEFKIRNDGQEPLAQDTRVKVTLPAGQISEEGLGSIGNMLRNHGYGLQRAAYTWDADNPETEAYRCYQQAVAEYAKWRSLASQLHELGDQWQTKEGNYTKRLSRLAYKQFGLKIPPALLSEVGNVASDHSRPVDHELEVTRNLNLSASEFCNDESCWWESYSYSRCNLKTNGGFGLRTFGDVGYYGESVLGRAWVMPLKQTDRGRLVSTFETLEPAALVVFNGYGNLDGYTSARILAHMYGWTYRKITFTCDRMYVNSESGYLIAPEEIAKDYTDGSLHLENSTHSNLFETEMNEKNEKNEKKVLVNA